MSGEPIPPPADPAAIRAALSQLGETLDALRERLGERENAAAEARERERAQIADRDEHALAIFQELLSIPPLGLPPGELFGLAMDRLSRLLAADRALLFVRDEATGRLVARSARGFRREDVESVAVDPSEGVIGRVFTERRVLTYDAGSGPVTGDPFVERFPVRQAIAVPVRTEGEVGGVLFAGRESLGAPFGTTDILLLLVIADRVGSALVHERLLQRQGDHVAQLRALRSLVEASRPAGDAREILARVCDVAARLARVPGVLALAGTDAGAVHALGGAGRLAPVGLERIRAGDPVLAEGFHGHGPTAIRDVQARSEGSAGVLAEEGMRAVMLVPLRTRERIVGLLALADSDPRDFTPEEVESAQLLAAFATAALEARRVGQELERAAAEQGARDADHAEREKARVLAALAAGLTRELNAAFAVLLGKSQLLLARAQSDPLREGLTALEEAAWRGTDVLQRLLGLAEADRPGGPAGDLSAIAHEAMGFTRARAPRTPDPSGRVEMTAELMATPPVAGSAIALREAIINLVLNAMEAMPAGGTVAVRTGGRDGGAELVVADRGEGIPPEVLPRIFDPFFTTRPGHLGLGLFVAQAVARRSGGRVEVQSGAGGTTVTMWLPAADAGGESAESAAREAGEGDATSSAPGPEGPPGSILLIEEEESVRAAVCDALTAVGHHVEIAEDATAALERLVRGGVDVVVTDLALRDRSGLQLAAAVKERSRHAAVVLLTGWGRRLHEARVRESGVDVMLVKPAQPERVRAAVAQALRLRRA
jgi:signal transduction histidine kinase/CheY-like chemotaxis protein